MTDPSSAPRLPVLKVIVGACAWPWYRRTAFVRALLVPYLLLVSLMVAYCYAGNDVIASTWWAVYAAYVFLFVHLAVNCHRVVLLNEANASMWTLPKWSWRETRFLGWFLLIWLIAAVGKMIVIIIPTITFTTGLGGEASKPSSGINFADYVGTVVFWYIFARLSLVLPSIAVDEKLSLSETLKRSHANGWRLLVVVCVLPYVTSFVTQHILRKNASAAEYIIMLSVWTIFLTIEISALSLSYRELSSYDNHSGL